MKLIPKIQAKRQSVQAPVLFKHVQIKAENVNVDSRTVSGYACIWGNKDLDGDISIKGSWAKSIADRGPQSNANNKIAFVWQHDIADPIGRITVLKEDDIGVYFEAVIDDIEQGNRALTQMKSGTLNQFSFGFMYVWDKMEYDDVLDAFIIKEYAVFEISPVTLGANPLTYFAGMKGEDLANAAIELQEETERLLKTLSAIKQFELRQLIAKHISLAKSEPPEEKKQALKDEAKPKRIDFSVFSQTKTA